MIEVRNQRSEARGKKQEARMGITDYGITQNPKSKIPKNKSQNSKKQNPKSKNPKLKTRNLKPETRNGATIQYMMRHPAPRDSKPVIRNRQSAIRNCAAVVIICSLLLIYNRAEAQEPVPPKNNAIERLQSMVNEKPLSEIKDSLIVSCFCDVLEKTSWLNQELYVLGTRLVQKDQSFFLGYMLRGFYLTYTATDRMGHEKAKQQLELALKYWPQNECPAMVGNMDSILSVQTIQSVSPRGQLFTYLATYYYLRLNYDLSGEYLELNQPNEAYRLLKTLAEENFAYDFHSLNKIAWLYYKYRYFRPKDGVEFLHTTIERNIAKTLELSYQQNRKIWAYRAAKKKFARYWIDANTTNWYEQATNNIISLAYGVGWQVDSSITYYEKMPEWFKLRNNGVYLYLADINYRAAERQFESIGKMGGVPIEVLQQPSAIEAYKNMLFYKGGASEAYVYLENYPKKYREDRGWGMSWLASANYWNGHLDEAVKNLQIANDYPEVFGNTSFNRTHYNMLVHIQQSLTYTALANRLDFEPNLASGFFSRLWNSIERFFTKN
jgi:hypothetical protein